MMESPVDSYPAAWRPLTPSGVAAFARASFGRLLAVQLVVGLLAAGTIMWVLRMTWYPTISTAIEHLPQTGEIRSGRLTWTAGPPQVLAESKYLALEVDPDHAAQARSPAHVQVEFGRTDVRFYSLFGCLPLAYPNNYVLGFNFREVKPWWGAWAPFLLVAAGAAAFAGLIISWTVLATLDSLPVWLLGLYLNRDLTFFGSWRLAGAALMPGALVMVAAIAVYGFGQLDLIQLLAACALHLIIGLAYLFLGVWAAPKLQSESGGKINPFTPASPANPKEPDAKKDQNHNPFRPSGD